MSAMKLFCLVVCASLAAGSKVSGVRRFASACVGCGIFITGLSPLPSMAAVGEGDLPKGAMAFSKLVKYQKDWDVLAKSVESRKDEMDQKEVLAIKLFLKQLANEYYDMDLLSSGMTDSTKAERGKALAKEFRGLIRQCDDAASDNNLGKIVELHPTTSTQLKDFFALMQDVPDEL